MTRFKKTAAGVLTAALCITLIVPAGAEGAAKKPKLSKSRLSVKTGKTATLKVKNAAKAKISWKRSTQISLVLSLRNFRAYTAHC